MFARALKDRHTVCIDFSSCPHLTADEFKQEADINFLLGRYKKTGSLYTVDEMLKARRKPRFGDFTGIPDYQESLNKMAKAMELFVTLPLAVRQRFNDDPVQLLAFLQDSANYDEAVRLGLIEKTIKTSEPPPVTTETTKNEEAKPTKTEEANQ